MAPSWAQAGVKKRSRGRSWSQDGGKLRPGGGKTSEEEANIRNECMQQRQQRQQQQNQTARVTMSRKRLPGFLVECHAQNAISINQRPRDPPAIPKSAYLAPLRAWPGPPYPTLPAIPKIRSPALLRSRQERTSPRPTNAGRMVFHCFSFRNKLRPPKGNVTF